MIPTLPLRLAGPAAPTTAATTPDQLGVDTGYGLSTVLSGPIDQAMQALWAGCAELLAGAFSLVDRLSKFSISTACDQHRPETCGSLAHLWPVLVSVSALIALGLFFWQITVATVRGGRGMLHAATGTVGYGIALAITVTVVASLLGAADGMTDLLLQNAVHPTSDFNQAYAQLPFTQQALNGIKPVILGVVGFFGLLPAALGYAMEMMFRQAAITVLVASIPFTAAGLLARSTARWFWISVRWMLTAVILKPAFALVLIIGLASLSNSTGLMGLLSGVAVLWVALFSPMALFRLLAFVDPATDAGGAFRDSVTSLASRLGTPALAAGAEAGSYASFGSPGGGNRGNTGGVSELEQANTQRFDDATPTSDSPGSPDTTEIGQPPPPPAPHSTPPADTDDPAATGQTGATDSTGGSHSPPPQGGDPSTPDPSAQIGSGGDHQPPAHHPDPGNDPPPPPDDPGAPGSGGVRPPGPRPSGPSSGGGGSGAAGAAEAAETAAVIL